MEVKTHTIYLLHHTNAGTFQSFLEWWIALQKKQAPLHLTSFKEVTK